MFKEFEKSLNAFVIDRDWDKYNHIKNITMNLCCEATELLEFFTLYNYTDHLGEVKKEIGDCFISLFSIYRVLNFDINSYISKKDFGMQAIEHIKKTIKKEPTPDLLIKYFCVRTGFLQEPFIWIEDKDSKSYKNNFPLKTLLEPFIILLALCHLLSIDPFIAMNEKLQLTAEKYSLKLAKNEDSIRIMNEEKIKKRGL